MCSLVKKVMPETNSPNSFFIFAHMTVCRLKPGKGEIIDAFLGCLRSFTNQLLCIHWIITRNRHRSMTTATLRLWFKLRKLTHFRNSFSKPINLVNTVQPELRYLMSSCFADHRLMPNIVQVGGQNNDCCNNFLLANAQEHIKNIPDINRQHLSLSLKYVADSALETWFCFYMHLHA